MGVWPAVSTGSISGADQMDKLLQFTIADRNVRGRIVRLGPVLAQILSAHAYPAPVRRILAEALVITALIGSLLGGGEGQLTIQVQTHSGIIELLVCDYRAGEIRGYVRHDRSRLDQLGRNPSLFALFDGGSLAIIFDMATIGQRYQGIVPLEGASLSEAVEHYFRQSEQVPTLLRVAVDCADGKCTGGGIILQHLAEGEEGRERLHVQLDHPEWEHVAILGATVQADELLEPILPLEGLVWRLFHEEREVRIQPLLEIVRGCRCSEEHYRNVLARFPEAERVDMIDENGQILVDCEFCSRQFAIDF